MKLLSYLVLSSHLVEQLILLYQENSMTEKPINKSDLDTLELKITKDQQQIRHNQNNELQKYYNMVDDLKTDSALSKQSLQHMTTSIEKLEKVVTDWFQEIKDEFKTMHTVFATKEEHLINKNEIQEIKSTHSKVISWLIGTVATIFVTFLWLIINTLWLK